MPSLPSHSGEMSQGSGMAHLHRTRVPAKATPALDPAARRSKRAYNALSASSVGLELGIAVVVGLLFGMWLDSKAGTSPWLMLAFLVLGLVAGFRNLMRAVTRAERAGDAEDRDDREANGGAR
jgi:ATP synthase protein I